MATGGTSLCHGSDEVIQHCDVCLSQSITSEAISFCTVCGELLCQSCDKAHRGSRASKDHTLLTGSNIPSGSTNTTPVLPIMFCDMHKTTLLDIFCDVHEEVICSMCKITNHTQCNTVDVRSHITRINVADPFNAVGKRLADLTSKFDNFKQTRQADKAQIKTQTQKCQHDLQELRRDINNTLDILEKKLASEIRDVEDKIEKEIKGQEAIVNDALVQITDLTKSLNDCQINNEAMFVGMTKVSSRKNDFEKILATLQKDIYKIDIRFQPNDVITDILLQLDTVGTVVVNKDLKYSSLSQSSHSSILNMSAVDKKEINIGASQIFGCTFMPDGQIVLGCLNDGLNVFDKDFQFRSKLSDYSLDVAAINDTDVIVTQNNLKQLQRVRVIPDLALKKTLKVDRRCTGVDVAGGEIYVSCHDDPGNGEIVVLNMDGRVLRRLGVDQGKYRFTKPYYLKVSKNGNKIFVPDWDAHTVTCLNKQGQVIYEYSDSNLRSPCGMYLDKEDNLLVCGIDSHNVHLVRRDGRKEKIMLSKKEGISYPLYLSQRPTDGRLVLVMHHMSKSDKKMVLFKLK